MPKRYLFLDFERKRCRVPPHYRRPIGPRPMQARTDRTHGRGMAARAAVKHALLAEGRAAGCRSGVPALIDRWVQQRVEQPQASP
jgi:hypothetical protein